jgi:hypothetical protein
MNQSFALTLPAKISPDKSNNTHKRVKFSLPPFDHENKAFLQKMRIVSVFLPGIIAAMPQNPGMSWNFLELSD